MNGPSDARGDYSSQRIEADRYRVSFAGNSMTERQPVETYLLYRAAELARQQGYDWFEEVHRDTENTGRTVVDRPFGPGAYGWWGPSWRYFGTGFGWRNWSPWYGDPFFGDTLDVRTINKYEATAEIVMHRGAKPAGNARAFDAADVLRTLGPDIRTPSQR
ncbi:CC0125/CC1285 family lipoprotein [Sphingomonas sp. ac-8]|uniref:CC0125/CC1285 family lipoprotein n=1 Tax=Sphingomonas sp. ac-8 TaxID=3242977 RepID=UPI003A7FA7E7